VIKLNKLASDLTIACYTSWHDNSIYRRGCSIVTILTCQNCRAKNMSRTSQFFSLVHMTIQRKSVFGRTIFKRAKISIKNCSGFRTSLMN